MINHCFVLLRENNGRQGDGMKWSYSYYREVDFFSIPACREVFFSSSAICTRLQFVLNERMPCRAGSPLTNLLQCGTV